MPRAALGYLAAAPIGILEAAGVLHRSGDSVAEAAAALEDLAVRLGPDRPTEDNEAKSVAQWFAGRTPLIWGTEGPAEAAALRWKTQLNENAKIPAFQAILPELDHNEIEGWAGESGSRFAAVVLRHTLEHRRTTARVDASLAALAASGLEGRQVRATGSSPLAIVFSLMMLGDFVSVYTAILRGVDPTPVPVLTGLKERLRE
jgi:glucose/mannose-6-phosphate isomerase